MSTRTFVIHRRQAGQPLLATLQSELRLARDDVLRVLRAGDVRLAGNVCTDPERRVRSGQRVHVTLRGKPPRPTKSKPPVEQKKSPPPPAAHGIVVRYVDEAIAVVEKPAGLTTVRHKDEARQFGARAKRFLPATLADLLPPILRARGALQQGRLRAVHRLDKETSGLVVFALTAAGERALGMQLRAHAVGRRYVALVRGQPLDGRIESYLVHDRGDGRRGSGPANEGQYAVTHIRVLEQLGDFALIECRLETGRTHQVRIHLGEAGTPLCGERVYDRPQHGQPLPDDSGARRPMLHAASLAIDHPVSGKRMEWEAPLPEDMQRLLTRLRRPANR